MQCKEILEQTRDCHLLKQNCTARSSSPRSSPVLPRVCIVDTSNEISRAV